MSKPVTITVTVIAVGLGIVVAYLVGGMNAQVAALEKQASQQADRLAKQDFLIADLKLQLQALPYRGTRMIRPTPVPPNDGTIVLNHETEPVPRPTQKFGPSGDAWPAPRPEDPGNYKLMRVRTLEKTRDVLYVMDMRSSKLVAMTFDSGKRKVEIIAGREIRTFDGFAIPPDKKFAESSVLTATIRTDIGEDTLAVVHNPSHMLVFYNLELGQKKIEISGSVDLYKLFNEEDAEEGKKVP